MKEKYLNNLELNKIVAMAAERAVCPEAKQRLLAEQPFTQVEDVRFLLSQTDSLAQHLLKNGNPRISSCEGADTAASRAEKGGVLSMGELLMVARALRNFSSLTNWYLGSRQQPGPVDDLFFAITPQPHLEKEIPEAILSESEMADTASDELYSLRRKIRQMEGSIREKLDSLVKSPGNVKFLQESIVSIRNGRFVVPVKAEHRNEVGGVIHDVSSSGSTIFVEPTAVVEANAKILQLKNQEQREIERLLQEFSQKVEQIGPLFLAGYDAMLEIDKRVAKAELGLSMNGICPAVNTEMNFSFIKARHPLLNKSTVVPVTIELGENYDTMVITGPNTGGKTVSLKTAGLLSAMAQMGYLLPAHDSSTVCVFEEILVDIGDEQSIEQSLSTFSGHMKNITDILRLATSKSLVLLDELGAGTDPAEGAALAISIIEKLRGTGARMMATTHYAEMKMFALETPGVQNAGSEFDIETLRPTYRLMVGVPGRSNAFLISEKLGIPEEVIAGARAHLSSEQQRFETVLSQLEDLKLQHKLQQEEIERLQYAAEHQLEEARKKRNALVKQGEDELAASRQRAKALAEEVQNQAYLLLDEIKRIEKDQRVSAAQKAQRAREIAKKESEALGQKAAKGESRTPKQFVPLTAVVQGQEVYLPEMDKIATVAAKPDKAGFVEIRMGAVKTKVPLAQLSAVPKAEKKHLQKQKPAPARGTGSEPGVRTPQREINLLGKTGEAARMETDQFIDNAVLTGLGTV
ncbi:MAG: endonuclease MutS2 [Oscillospiraceae bacterium]